MKVFIHPHKKCVKMYFKSLLFVQCFPSIGNMEIITILRNIQVIFVIFPMKNLYLPYQNKRKKFHLLGIFTYSSKLRVKSVLMENGWPYLIRKLARYKIFVHVFTRKMKKYQLRVSQGPLQYSRTSRYS